jgi:hypothetical protein
MEVPLGDTYYFSFTTRAFSTGIPTTLSGTPALSVKEEANDTIITSGVTVDVDTGATPVTGLNEAAVVATSGNGYEVGKYYSVYISTGTVDSVSAVGEVVGHFRVMPAEDAGAGIKDVNTVTIEDTDATNQINAACDASIVTYHLDHLLAATYDPASKPGAADALLNEMVENDGGVSRFTANALENGPGGTPSQPLLQSTTIASYSSNTSFTLTAGSADNDAYNNQMIVITDQTTGTQKAIGLISDYVGGTKTVTLDADPLPAFTFANGDTVEIWAVTGSQNALEVDVNGRVDVGSVAGTAQTAGNLASLITTADAAIDNVQSTLDNGTTGLGALSTDIATAQADLDIITGPNGVNIDSTVQASLIDNILDETLTSHVTADSLAVAIKDTLADTNELQTDNIPGTLTTIDGKIDTIDTEVGLIQADLDNGTDGLGAIKTETAAIKTKTDNMVFTKANELDVNTKSINSATVTGDGNATPWDGA